MQQSNRIKIFAKFAQSVKPLLTKETMTALNQQYYIREFKIWEIDTAIACNLYFGIITRNKRTPERIELGWVQNQLRLFVWTLVLYAASKRIDIQELTEDNSGYDWQLFCEIFPSKPLNLFIYQGKNLLKKHNQYKKWVHEQDTLFEQLVKRDNYRLKWSDLGKYLFIQSNRKYFRTPKQCRERWLNHLDPSKLKKYWLEEEDFILIEFVRLHGKKWAAISKKLENKRNQHSIKNRFKSLLTRESKQQMKPFNEEQLVDSLYHRLLQRSKRQGEESRDDKEKEENSKRPEAEEDMSSSSEEYDSVSIFEEKEGESVHDILSNISLNTVKGQVDEGEDKSRPNWQAIDKQAFEFSRNAHPEPSDAQHWKKDQANESEIQKRIRADLFLQEDPFEMLKSYFYKGQQQQS